MNTVPTQRISPAMLSPAIKSLNYLNNILAKIEGNLYGAQESIMLNAQGYVAECTADNIFVIKKDKSSRRTSPTARWAASRGG